VKAEEDDANSAQFSFCLIADIVKCRTANSCPAFFLYAGAGERLSIIEVRSAAGEDSIWKQTPGTN
jgi:hypothetical protein